MAGALSAEELAAIKRRAFHAILDEEEGRLPQVKALYGGKPIADLNAPEVLTTVRRIEARGRLETAHRALQSCGQVFRYAVATGRAERDPTGDLRGALMLSINQEFDHNTSQQLYVSETLWQIITLAKNETLAFVSQTASDLPADSNADELVSSLLQAIDQMPATPLQRAIVAIRTEAGQLF